MIARKGRYAAAYTHREPSRDDELRHLLQGISEQRGSGLLFVGPDVRAIDNSALATGLVKGGTAHYTTWKKKDWWQQERVIALWPDDKALQQLDDVATRSGRDVTARLSELAPIAGSFCGRRLVLDGELVAHEGTPASFYRLGGRMAVTRPLAIAAACRAMPLTFVAFDVLHDGEGVTAEPYRERRARLESLGLRGPAWTMSPANPRLGAEVFAACTALGLEGLVAKRLVGRYHPGERHAAWVKAKTATWRAEHADYRHES